MKESVGFKLLKLVGIVVLVVVVFFPFYWLLVSSFKTERELLGSEMTFIPRTFSVAHYYRVLFESRYALYMANSLIVAGATTLIIIVLSISTGYSLSCFRYPGRKAIERSIIYTRMFPGVLLIIPIYVLMANVRLLNTRWALIVVYVTMYSPMSILLLKNFFDSVPGELREAAYIDGATRRQTLTRVILPLLVPGLVTVAAYAFVLSWSEYVFGMILINKPEVRTVVVGLAAWMGEYYVDWGALTAGSILVVLPVVAVFGVLGRGFIKGLSAGAIKG